jgi:signal transduction histidine kinase
VAGTREADRQAARLDQDAHMAAREVARQLAMDLAVRLEALREVESSRPHFHYQHRYHDHQEGCACAAYRLSPLAEGRGDPLVHAYFQIDEESRLGMPTLDDEAEVMEEGEWSERQQEIRNSLEEIGPQLSVALSAPPEREEAPHFQHVAEAPASEAPTDDAAGSDEAEEELLVALEPFRWRTLALDGGPALFALRGVETTERELVQGFVVSGPALVGPLKNAAYPARLLQGAAAVETAVDLPIPGAAWRVEVDASTALAAARSRAAAARAGFLRVFRVGVAGAVLAGACLLLLVWTAERMATQRARFAAAAAHELRTPLAGLRLHGEMLADGLGDPARRRQYAGRVAQEAERLGRVVSNVLGYTRLEQGGLGVHLTPGDLGTTVKDCVARLRPAVESAGGRLELEMSGELPPVRFDADAVQQIVQNLVDNAEKYARRATDRTIRVSLLPRNSTIDLSVSDHGPGIAPALQSRLFRPFVRGGNGEQPAGLGLGLTLVRELAHAQGGRVRYSAAPDGGSIFTVSFRA